AFSATTGAVGEHHFEAVYDQSLLTPPVNVLRLSLHPQGLAPQIKNLSEWRAHLIGRLRQQFSASGDPMLDKLLKELLSYPAP
ncbi:transcriptional regulator, partial [Rhizobium ruizarguesonis]